MCKVVRVVCVSSLSASLKRFANVKCANEALMMLEQLAKQCTLKLPMLHASNSNGILGMLTAHLMQLAR